MTKPRPRKKLNQEAYDAGAEAFREGRPFLVPDTKAYGMSPTLQNEWRDGWREAKAAVAVPRAPEPEVETQALPEPEYRFWPVGKPMPTEYVVHGKKPQPCKGCRRVYLADNSQAVTTSQVFDGIARLKSRCCKDPEDATRPLRWKLQVSK